MELVVDANIVFAALIKAGATQELLFDDRLSLVAPYCVFDEVREHQDTLLRKMECSKEEFEEFLTVIGDNVNLIPMYFYREELKKVALFSPDNVDDEYLALALRKGIPLWSNDVALKRQSSVRVLSTREVIELLGK